MRSKSILALAAVLAAPAAAQSTDPTGVATARDELLADFEAAVALKLEYCEYRVSPDESVEWVAMPKTYRRDPYLSEAEQRRAATEWLATEWEAEGPFPKRFEWEFQLMAEEASDGNAPDRAVYSWDPESQRLFLGISFAFPVELDLETGREMQPLPAEIGGPTYPTDHPQHVPRVVCLADECHVSLRPGLDVSTARRLRILERQLPVTLRLELVVEPAGEGGDLSSSGTSLPTGRQTTAWGCQMPVGEMRVGAWEVSIDGRRYAGG